MMSAAEDAARFSASCLPGIAGSREWQGPRAHASRATRFFRGDTGKCARLFRIADSLPGASGISRRRLAGALRPDNARTSSSRLPCRTLTRFRFSISSHGIASRGRALEDRAAAPDWGRVLAFTGHKWEFVTQQLGYLVGNDIYDSYLEGRIGAAVLRKLFLEHLEAPGAAQVAYANLKRAAAVDQLLALSSRKNSGPPERQELRAGS